MLQTWAAAGRRTHPGDRDAIAASGEQRSGAAGRGGERKPTARDQQTPARELPFRSC
jgi:hypothetical protein